MSESVSSRREFLKASSLTVAGAALAAGTGLVRMAHAAGNDEIRVAVIGCGGRGAGAAANCLDADPTVKIVAIADAFQDRIDSALNMLKGKYGERIDVPRDRQFAGLEAYKQAVACNAQLVVMATPPGFRPAQYAAAIQAGKHVFMEKPVRVDAPGFRSADGDEQAGRRERAGVAVGLQRQSRSPRTWKASADPRRQDRRHPISPQPTGMAAFGSSPRSRADGNGIPDPQLVLLQLAQRRPYLRAAHPQLGL